MTDIPKKLRATEKELKINIENRHRALEEAYCNPKDAPRVIIEACKSQSSLAKLHAPKNKITPMARESLYKYADLVLTDTHHQIPKGEKGEGKTGKAYLDWLRKKVYVSGTTAKSYRSKASREERSKKLIESSSNKLLQTEQHALALSKAYVQLFRDIRIFAKSRHLNEESRQRLFNILNNADGLYNNLFGSEDLRKNNVEHIPNEKA